MNLFEKQEYDFRFIAGDAYVFRLHFHSHIEFAYITSGYMTVQVGDKKRVLGKGDLAVAFPNVIHGYEIVESSPDATFELYIVSPEFAGVYRRAIISYLPDEPIIAAADVDPDIVSGLRSMSRALGETFDSVNESIQFFPPSGDTTFEDEIIPFDREIVTTYLAVILMRIFRTVKMTAVSDNMRFDLTHQLLTYLQQHCLESVTLDNVAHALHVSKYQISRVMSSRLQTTLPTYLNQLRLSYAMDMLFGTSLTITEISERCGFKSERTFHRAFKAMFGCEPRRRRNAEEQPDREAESDA